MSALRFALEQGVRHVHSNPKLLTQWAVRRVLDDLSFDREEVRHLVKVEAPLDDAGLLVQNVRRAVTTSCAQLGIHKINTLVVEIDIKRCRSTQFLSQPAAVAAFFRQAATAASATGQVESVSAYCHRAEHVEGALRCPEVSGIAATYHRRSAWAADLFDQMELGARTFVGMGPLARGALVGKDRDHRLVARLPALRWALNDSRVTAVAVTMSSVRHAAEVIEVVDDVSRH